MLLQARTPFDQYFDSSGVPLNGGSIYIGTANLNPETNPIGVYWDSLGTQPAAQPLKTNIGAIVRAGSPARIYVNAADFSMTVRDKKGKLVFTCPSVTTYASSAGISFTQDGTGGLIRTVQDKLTERVSLFDFMTQAQIADVKALTALTSPGSAIDVSAPVQAAITYALSTCKRLYAPYGAYLIGTTLNVATSAAGGFLFEGTTVSDIIHNTGSTFVYTGSGSAMNLSTSGPTYSSIKNIGFLGTAGVSAVALDINGTWYIDVDQCMFKGFKASGYGTGVYIHYSSGAFAGVATIRNCIFTGNYVGLLMQKQDINVIRFYNNIVIDNTYGLLHGQDTLTPVSSRNVDIIDNLFEGNADYDIFSYGGAQNWNINGNYFEQNDVTRNTPRINMTATSPSVRNCAISIVGNTFSKQLQGAGQKLVYVQGANGLVFKNNWSAFGSANDRFSIHADGCINTELMQMSVPFADTPYPINDSSILRLTGSVYKMEGGIALAGGIEFPSTAVLSSNANTLDDYEEGTWTPANTYVTLTNNTPAIYRKIGSFVYAAFDVTFPANAQGNLAEVKGLPFVSSNSAKTVWVNYSDYGDVLYMRNDYNTVGLFYTKTGAGLTNANMSGKRVSGAFIYCTD